MRVLVVGAGSIGRRHIGNLIALGCEVFVFDMSIAAQEAAFGLGAHPKSLMSSPPDAVVVATPWDEHLRSAEQAIETGRALFVEKPLGAFQELSRWRDLARCEGHGCVTQVGYMLRFHPAAQSLRAVTDPMIGRFTCQSNMDTWPGSSYGPILLEASHEIDLALWAGAPSSRVSVDICTDKRAAFSLCGDKQRWRVQLEGEARHYERRWYVASEAAHVEVAIDRSDALGDAMYRAEMEHFLNAVRTGTQSQPAATLADGIKVLEVCAMVEQAAKVTA